MINSLKKLSEALKDFGFEREAEQVMLLSKRSQDSTQQSRRDNAEQKIAGGIGKDLASRLNISSGPLFSMIMDVGNHGSFSSWIRSQPERIVEGRLTQRILGLGTPILASVTAALSIPALASWNFNSIGNPREKVLDLYIRQNRDCLYRGWTGGIERRNNDCSPTPLGTSSFNPLDTETLNKIKNGETYTLRVQPMTGTPPPLIAYTLMLSELGGGMEELLELRDSQIVTEEVSNLVREAGLAMRDSILKANRDMKMVIREIGNSGIYADTPEIT